MMAPLNTDRVLAALTSDWLTVGAIAKRAGVAPGAVNASLSRFGSAGPVESKYTSSGHGTTPRTLWRRKTAVVSEGKKGVRGKQPQVACPAASAKP